MNDLLQAQALVLALYEHGQPYRIHASYIKSHKAAVRLASRLDWVRLAWCGTIHLTQEGLAFAKEMTS